MNLNLTATPVDLPSEIATALDLPQCTRLREEYHSSVGGKSYRRVGQVRFLVVRKPDLEKMFDALWKVAPLAVAKLCDPTEIQMADGEPIIVCYLMFPRQIKDHTLNDLIGFGGFVPEGVAPPPYKPLAVKTLSQQVEALRT